MAVCIICMDLVIKIEVIEKKYPGGFSKFLEDQEDREYQWHDNFLFHDGSKWMDADRIHGIVDYWESLGFIGFQEDQGRMRWNDFCFIDYYFIFPDYVDKNNLADEVNCDWLVIDRESGIAYLKGTDPGVVACRDWRWIMGEEAWNNPEQCLIVAEIAKLVDGNDHSPRILEQRAAELKAKNK